jgi:hypothetical protein
VSIDERLEFLVRTTESLHVSVQELRAVVTERTRQLEKIDAQNIRSRTKRQLAILEEHEFRKPL